MIHSRAVPDLDCTALSALGTAQQLLAMLPRLHATIIIANSPSRSTELDCMDVPDSDAGHPDVRFRGSFVAKIQPVSAPGPEGSSSAGSRSISCRSPGSQSCVLHEPSRNACLPAYSHAVLAASNTIQWPAKVKIDHPLTLWLQVFQD